VFFAWRVLWPAATEAAPFSGPPEWATLAFGIAAFIALFRFGVGIIPVIGACGAAGLMYSFSKPLLGI